MNVKQLRVFIGLLTAVGAFFHQARGAALAIGDAAPRLQASKWIQGEPVKEFARDKVYLVEFWATWCGPCRASIPHLNAWHQKFKDRGLIVIGQDVRETQPADVAPFVKEMGTNMTYRVALDTPDDAMARTWMEAAGEEGIPVAFIVDRRGLIAWIGHPLELKEPILEAVLAGTFDTAKAAAEYSRQRSVEGQLSALLAQFGRHVRNEEWDAAEKTLNEAGKIWPEEARSQFDLRRFQFLLDRGQYAQAYRVASELSEAHPDDAMLLNSLAWTIATKDGVNERDLVLAEKIARRARAVDGIAGADRAEILDTLARVLFLKGETKPAVELQEEAVRFATGERKTHFSKILADYKAGRMPSDTRVRSLHRELSRSIQNGDWSQAEATLAALEKELPAEESARLDSYRFSIFAGRGDYVRAEKIVERLAPSAEKNAMMLNSLAWNIAIRPGAPAGELELAEKIARRANDATKGTNPEILDTLARLVFRKGEKAAAIALQEKAVTFAKGRRATQFQETLDSFKAGELPKAY